MRKRTSVVWKISIEELKKIVKKNDSFAKILKHFGMAIASGNYKTLKKRLNYENISYSHISQGLNNNKGRKFPERAIPLKEVMVKNSTYCRGTLKKRLLENKCNICGQISEHNNIKLIMVLDHINGVSNDHRVENLRLLCPNCNSQQKTFAGRNSVRKKYNCITCGKKITKHSKLCKSCSARLQKRKVKNRPSVEQLLKEIKETNYCAVGRKYDVSDSAIRKWLK